MIQYTTHQPRNGIGQILSHDQCQVRGCLDYLPMVCIGHCWQPGSESSGPQGACPLAC